MSDTTLEKLLVRCSEVPRLYNEISNICYKKGFQGAEIQLLVCDIVRDYLENNSIDYVKK